VNIVGRVWPRHSHRGSPLNSVVRSLARDNVMITAVVQFKLPKPVTREKAQELFLGSE
jgi:hypothetical protein